MAAPREVVITTDSSGQLWNACVWDIKSGTSLLTYKGNTTGAQCLCVLGTDYLLGAVSNKPLLQVWCLPREEQLHMKMVCPGKVSSLAVTSDGSYCVAGIAEKIHLWQVATGDLLTVLTRHYQTVTCLKFTDDSGYFISGGEDSLVVVWSLSSVICRTSDPTMKEEPTHTWSGHSLPITDIHVGIGGQRARVVTSSLDQTCKLWDICSGSLLLAVMFDGSVTSVAMDTPEYRLFAGSSSGTIFTVNLFTQPVQTERHVSSSDTTEAVAQFQGHSKQVSCLSVSLDGSQLISGSHDTKVKVWDILSGQCIRTIDHKGAVTNVISLLAPGSMFRHDYQPNLPIESFKRHLYTADESRADNPVESLGNHTVDVRISHLTQPTERTQASVDGWKQILAEEKANTGDIVSLEEKVLTLETEVNKLQTINKELYDFTLNHLKYDAGLT